MILSLKYESCANLKEVLHFVKLLIFMVSHTFLYTTVKTIHPMFSLKSSCSCLLSKQVTLCKG